MGKIDTYIAFVKEHVGIQNKLAKRYEDTPYRKSQHVASAKGLTDLADFLEQIRDNGTQDTSYLHRSDSLRKKLLLTYEEIEGVPEEGLKELNLTEADRQDLLTEYLIARAGGILPLDKIMLQLWKKVGGDFPKRNTLTSRLYRMGVKGMIFNVPGKKGYYSTYEVTEEEAKKLFGVDGEAEEPTQSAPAAATEVPAAPAPAKSMFPRRLSDSKYATSTSAGALNRRT